MGISEKFRSFSQKLCMSSSFVYMDSIISNKKRRLYVYSRESQY